jgi:hypothetical protein
MMADLASNRQERGAVDKELEPFLFRKEAGYAPLYEALIHLARDLPRGVFMLFCRSGAVGSPLKRDFDQWRKTLAGQECVGSREAWRAYAKDQAKREFEKNPDAYRLPEGCELPDDRRRLRLARLRTQIQDWDPDDVLQAHFGDEQLLLVLKAKMCGGCHRASCLHNAFFRPEEEPPTIRRNPKPPPREEPIPLVQLRTKPKDGAAATRVIDDLLLRIGVNV